MKSAGTRETVEDGVVGVVVMGKARVEFGGVVEDLEGEVEVGFASVEGDEALWVEASGPGLDWWGHGVGVEEIDGGDGRGGGGGSGEGDSGD